MSDRPNIILFITDQQRADYLGCTGHPVLKTPNIDSMAEGGTLWENFYVASPVCMPNRASLMTCRLPSSHGVRSNGIPLDKRNVTFVELLRDAGYQTAIIGKSHLQNFTGKPPMMARPVARNDYHPEDGKLSEAIRHNLNEYTQELPGSDTNLDTPFYGFDHVEVVTGHGDATRGDYRHWLLQQDPDADQLIGADNQWPHDYVCPQAIRTRLPEELYSTSWITDRAVEWLEQHAQDEQPWFLMVSFPDPHHPFNPPGKYWDMYKPDQMSVPKAFQVNDWVPPAHVSGIISQRESGEANLAGMGAIGTSVREAKEAQALTCGMIAMIDDAVGQVRAVTGANDAIQIFTTDHGDHLGDHRLLFKGAEQYEQLTHVPFIWSDPHRGYSGVESSFGQTHDIGVTILDRANIEPAIGMQGQSLLDGGRDAAFIQYDHQKDNPGIGVGPRIHTLRVDRWRVSVIDKISWGEMYDLKNDPGELVNLWGEAAYADVQARLIERLLREEIAAVDRVPFPIGLA